MNGSVSIAFLLMLASLPIHADHVIFADGFETPPTNTITSIDAFPVGLRTSIAVGSDGYPVISFGDNFEGSLRLVNCDGIKCDGGHSTIATIDKRESRVGWPSAIAIGQDGFPVIAYSGQLSPWRPLLIAKCNDPACTGGGDAVTVVADDILEYVSLALGTDGYPLIAYEGNRMSVKVIKCNDPACAGGDETRSVVDDQGEDPGQYTTVAIGTNGNPVIAYWDRVGGLGQVVVASCNDPACAGGDEMITVLDGPSHVGQGISLAIGSDGLPIISYLEGPYPHSLKVLHCGKADCTP